jgi:hypothetical protein
VARDVYIRLDRCQYCGQPGFVVWDDDLFTCGREVCEALAFAEVRRRHHEGNREPEKKLARALLAAFDTFDHAVRLDEEGEVLSTKEAAAIRERERAGTAHLLSELRELARRYPPPPAAPFEPRRARLSRGTARAGRVPRRSATTTG